MNNKPVAIDQKDYEKLKVMHFRQMLDSHFGDMAQDMTASAKEQDFKFDEVNMSEVKDWIPAELEEFVRLHGDAYLIVTDPTTASFLPGDYRIHVTHDVRFRHYLAIARRVNVGNSALMGFVFNRMVKITQPAYPSVTISGLL